MRVYLDQSLAGLFLLEAMMQIEKMKLADLKPAEYNPRIKLESGMPEYEKLKLSLEEFGMVDPPIFNKQTGNLVGGHQRVIVAQEIGLCDEIEVVVVDLPINKEKALNLALNKIAGVWDEEKLSFLFEELEESDFNFTGFEDWEIDSLKLQEFSFNDIPELQESEYIEPDKKELVCPHCGHIDSAERFKKYEKSEEISDVEILPANTNDLDMIKNVADQFTKELGFVHRETVKKQIEKQQMFCAKSNGKVVGFCSFNNRKDGITIIYEIAVLVKYRGNSIAKKMIKELNYPIRLKCPVGNDSNNFYAALGFELIEVEEGRKRKLNVWEKKSND